MTRHELRTARPRVTAQWRAALFAIFASILLAALINMPGFDTRGSRPAAWAAPVWEEQNSNTRLTLRGIDCVDENHCWAVGGEGEVDEHYVILRTDNGGRHWGSHAAPDARRLESVSFVDTQYGWAVGTHGQILKTVDGGLNWFKQESGMPGRRLLSVQFLDRQRGWVALQREPALLITSNGGETWEKQPIVVLEDPDEEVNIRDGLSTIFMVDENRGWAHGTDEVLLHTRDGGRTWVNQISGTASRMYGIFFLNPSLGWAVGADIRKTLDGGTNWVRKHGTGNTGRDVRFVDENRGYLAGDKGVVMSTSDGGETWVKEATEFGERSYLDLALGGAAHLWIVGTGGTIVHRYDPDLKPTPTNTPTATNTPTNTPTPTPTPTPAGPWLRLFDPANDHPAAVLLIGPGQTRSLRAEHGNLTVSAHMSITLEGPLVFGDGSAILEALYSVEGEGAVDFEVRAAEGAMTGQAVSVWAAILDDAGVPFTDSAVAELVGAIADVLGMPWVSR